MPREELFERERIRSRNRATGCRAAVRRGMVQWWMQKADARRGSFRRVRPLQMEVGGSRPQSRLVQRLCSRVLSIADDDDVFGSVGELRLSQQHGRGEIAGRYFTCRQIPHGPRRHPAQFEIVRSVGKQAGETSEFGVLTAIRKRLMGARCEYLRGDET